MHSIKRISVCMITYAHESFIEQAIRGVIQQAGDFEIELVIADDASPDNTAKVVEGLMNSLPEKRFIKYYRHKKNKGMRLNFIWALQQCTGSYIGLCEGDDFWTDSNKIQTQLTYLEQNPSAAGCFHDACTVNISGSVLKENYFVPPKEKFNQYDCLTRYGGAYATCSLLFRKAALVYLPTWFERAACDYTLDILITAHGELVHIPKTMSAYRIHEGGIWQGQKSLKNMEVTAGRHRVLYSDPSLRKLYGDFLKKNITQLSLFILTSYRKENHWRKHLQYSWYHFLYGGRRDMFAFKVLVHAFLYPVVDYFKKVKSYSI